MRIDVLKSLKNSPRRHERLYGCRRYDSTDGGGRAMQGAIAESTNSRRFTTAGGRATQGAVAEAQLPLQLTLSTYIIHRDVVNADIAGANICPCRQRRSNCREHEEI
jgi:hypothetical protein